MYDFLSPLKGHTVSVSILHMISFETRVKEGRSLPMFVFFRALLQANPRTAAYALFEITRLLSTISSPGSQAAYSKNVSILLNLSTVVAVTPLC